MTLSHRFAVSVFVALALVKSVRSEETQGKSPNEEDARLGKIIDRWLRLHETEREHVAREVGRAGGGDRVADDDFRQWYTRLGGTDDGWDRKSIQRKAIVEIFDRIAERSDLQGPILARDQFLRYAKDWWVKDKSPPWRERAPAVFETAVESEKLFRRLDHDGDGYLGGAEICPALRADMKRWDRNNDGWIDPQEYRAYFAHRLDHVYRELQQRSERPLPPLDIPAPDDARPVVPRAGKLPAGLPAWFEQLDLDHDGQIALYEWRRAGKPLDEFTRLDLNDDGFIEPGEIFRLLAITDRDGNRPFAYLFQKQGRGKDAVK